MNKLSTVKHKFLDRKIDPRTEILIIGTFNPDTDQNTANYFYSRGRNYLWRLLPTAFGEHDLRQATREEKEKFAISRHIDFIDLISEVEIERGSEANYADRYIDRRVPKSGWTNVIQITDGLPLLKRACFTRKNCSDVPAIGQQVAKLKEHFERRKVFFQCIISPARFYSEQKQIAWNKFLRSS